jgi:glycosyltransferase involved in cell wall biosynthesis
MDNNSQKKHGHPRYDLLFIGSDNVHNQKGIKWFFEEIYPRLFRSIRVLIVGPITQYVQGYDNVTCIPYVDHIADAYKQSRISICPLLGGTGMKIKIIEALSYGLPVVTTEKGHAGFPSQSRTGAVIADSPEKFANCIHQFLTDQDYYDQHKQYAQNFFYENFEKSVVYQQLDRVFL